MIEYRSSVSSPETGVWAVSCSCGWESGGWGSQQAAATRMGHHRAEHATGEPMPELKDVSL